jgi:hypothetical protein
MGAGGGDGATAGVMLAGRLPQTAN